MLKRTAAALPVSLLLSLLHVGCCLFPLLLAGFSSLSIFHTLGQYKPFFTILQTALLIYLGTGLLRSLRWGSRWHFGAVNRTYLISFVIGLVALVFGIAEPLQTEEQQLARQRFEYFKSHGRVELTLAGDYDQLRLVSDLKSMEGIKPATVKVAGNTISASFKKQLTSEDKILMLLKTEGYQVTSGQ